MANYYSDPLRPARPGRIDAQVHPTPTYHGESLVPDYSKWMPGLADYDRLQRNRAAGVPVGQYGPAPTRAPSANPAFPPAPTQPQPFMPPSINSGAHGLFPGAGALPAWPSPSVGSSFVPFAPASSPVPGPGPSTPTPAPLAVAPPLPSYLLSRDNVGNARFTDGSRIATGADGSKTLLIRDGSGSATFGERTQPSTIEHTPGSDWFVQQAQAHHAANAFANYDPQTGQASPRTGSSIGGLPSSVWFARQAEQSGQSNRYANFDPATGKATPVTPPAAPAATATPNTAPAAAPADPDKKPPGTLQARAMKSPPYSHARSFTPEMLAKMDAASLAALALRPRAPGLYRQWREDPASLPELKRENPSSAQALAARALRPRFGPGASSAAATPLMRSGPRSAEELAKLDPATLAALALQPRAPQMRRRWQQGQKATAPPLGGGGLNAGTMSRTDDPNAIAGDNNTSSTPSVPASLPAPNFTTDPNSYLQPAVSPGISNAPISTVGQQTPIFTFPPKSLADQSPFFSGESPSPGVSRRLPDSSSDSEKRQQDTSIPQPILPASNQSLPKGSNAQASPVADHEIEPSDLDRQVFNSIYEGSPTARMLYNYAQSKGYPLQIMRPGDVSKFNGVPGAKATAIEDGPFKRIYVDSLGNQASGDWAHYTSPYHEIIHVIQHDLKGDKSNKTQAVPDELRKMIDSVTYPSTPQGPNPSDETGAYADFQARRIQNNIVREYYQSLNRPVPPQFIIKEYAGESLDPRTYYGKGYSVPSDVPKLTPPIKPKSEKDAPPVSPRSVPNHP